MPKPHFVLLRHWGTFRLSLRCVFGDLLGFLVTSRMLMPLVKVARG
jgi:hypothetical protein